jgi:hypothetical protein
VDTIAFYAGLSEVDNRQRKLIGDDAFNAMKWRQDQGFLEALAEAIATLVLYGDEQATATDFTGMRKRCPSLTTATSGSQVVSYGSSEDTDISSMYVVDWGEEGVHFIYPENAPGAGVDVRPLGEQRVTDIDSNPFTADVTEYEWLIGLSVEDPRHLARLANIDLSLAAADTSFTLGLKLIDVLTGMPDPGGMQRVLYCSRSILAAFFKQALNKSNAALSIRDYLGKPTPHFWEYPIRSCDAFASDESVIT